MLSLYKRPTYALLALALASVALIACTVWFALKQPWVGVQMAVVDDKVRVVHVVEALVQQIPEGVEVKRLVSATGVAQDVLVSDLIEEPDFFNTYPEMAEFFSRQSTFEAMLRDKSVTLVWVDASGVEKQVTVTPTKRPFSSLPMVFWFQVIVGFIGFLIASWIFLLRKDDWAARMFWLSGLAFPLFTVPAAIYSTRELAMQGETIRWLASLNHLGAFMFGCTLVAIFMTYPRKLVRPIHLLWLPAIFGLWLAADVLRWAPDQDWGSRMPVSVEMLLAIVFAVVQWRKTRGQPLERAALRWFTLSTLVGSGLFIFITVGSQVLGLFDMPKQGYAFGYFLLIYIGIALGLRHYQLFDMDEWAYRGFMWVVGALSVIALDALLIYFGLTEATSLGVSLLIAGWLYFPLRQWMWQRIVKKHYPKFESLLPELSAIAFTASHSEQKFRWESFLMRVFDPLEMKQGEADIKEAGVLEEGLALQVPASATLPSYTLRYAGRGIRLFSTRDADFAMALSQLLHQVMGGRSSYEQGVAQERLRIGRDLHDNIGARLLKLIHHLRGTPDAEIARDAMKDLRTSIAAMDSQPIPLRDALADWRAEANARCEVAKCQLHWNQSEDIPEVDLPPRMKGMLESVMREVITNALKHASPRTIQVGVEASVSQMKVEVENDGSIADPLTWQDGYGLRNIRGRMEEMGGNLNISSSDGKVRLTLATPFP
ncbi:MAG: hypothetical protein C0406_00945 [Sideroxydans sp.]|nr:hypothetical protein [Sideroxydans sp.]